MRWDQLQCHHEATCSEDLGQWATWNVRIRTDVFVIGCRSKIAYSYGVQCVGDIDVYGMKD